MKIPVAQIAKAEMEIFVAGTAEGITMVEGGAHEVSEEVMLGALDKANEFIKIMWMLTNNAAVRANQRRILTGWASQLSHYLVPSRGRQYS